MKWIRTCIFLCLIFFSSALTHAQDDLFHGSQLKVFLITFGPGSDAWEKFGHDAIVIQDPMAGTDIAYNWGVFNFGQGISGFTAFSWHFLQGRLLYSMQSEPTGEMLEAYQAAGRSILAQELNLTPSQKLGLQARLFANDTEANRYYLYDYFKKNCSTMARDAIDQTVDGRVHAALENVATSTTYRWHDRRTTADTLWLYFFLDYSLGHPVDIPLSAWEECFLPGKLAQHLLSVQVPDQHGRLAPLVTGSKEFSASSFPERKVPPTSYFYWFLATGIALGVIAGALGSLGRKSRLSLWIFVLIVELISVITGALGAVITFAWFTNHAAAKWNENLFQINPLSLLLIVLAPAIYRWPLAAKRVAGIVLGFSAMGLIAKLTPWFWQTNGQIIAIMLPVHAGIAWGLRQSVPGAIKKSNMPAPADTAYATASAS